MTITEYFFDRISLTRIYKKNLNMWEFFINRFDDLILRDTEELKKVF